MTPENCPACGRELSELRDFPNIKVKSVELLPLPEKILHWSSIRSVEPVELKEEDLPDEFKGVRVVRGIQPEEKEIDLTEEIKGIIKSESMRQYLEALQKKVGLDIETNQVLPPFETPFERGFFPWAFAIPDSNYFLSIANEEGREDAARLKLWGRGPNMGSAGGPTLYPYAELARIEFKGRLLPTAVS